MPAHSRLHTSSFSVAQAQMLLDKELHLFVEEHWHLRSVEYCCLLGQTGQLESHQRTGIRLFPKNAITSVATKLPMQRDNDETLRSLSRYVTCLPAHKVGASH